MEAFKETFSKIISYKHGKTHTKSNMCVVVKDFHKLIFSTSDWLATTSASFSKYKVKHTEINEIIEDPYVRVHSTTKTTTVWFRWMCPWTIKNSYMKMMSYADFYELKT